MSRTIPTTSTSNFHSIFVAALEKYRKKTKTELIAHPLVAQLQSCNTSSDVLAVLHEAVNEFDESGSNKK
jgi:hypothetical protein